jgi:hypothetical protein
MMTAAQGLNQLAADLKDAYASLQGRLDEIGEVWGSDATGQAFRKEYVPARDKLLNGMSSSAGAAGSGYDGLETTAKGFEGTEEQNTASIHVGGNGAGESGPRSSGSPGGPRG